MARASDSEEAAIPSMLEQTLSRDLSPEPEAERFRIDAIRAGISLE
jgi:hypothetical protein